MSRLNALITLVILNDKQSVTCCLAIIWAKRPPKRVNGRLNGKKQTPVYWVAFKQCKQANCHLGEQHCGTNIYPQDSKRKELSLPVFQTCTLISFPPFCDPYNFPLEFLQSKQSLSIYTHLSFVKITCNQPSVLGCVL